jgi:hypothetical protein
MAVRTIPFDAGQQQGIDRALLSGKFSLVRNGVLSRDGQLRPRPAYTAIPDTAYGDSSTTVAIYDLFSYNDRLVAFGDVLDRGYPTDVFEYVDGAQAWRGTVVNPTFPRLPRATRVRDLAQPPDQDRGALNMSCAAFGDFACMVWNTNSGTQAGYIQVIRSSTGQVLLSEPVDGKKLRVVELPLTNRFVVIGINDANTSISAWFFRPASDETLQTLDLTLTTGVGLQEVNIAPIEGISTQFIVVSVNTGGTVAVDRFDIAGVPSGISYTDIAAGIQASGRSVLALATFTGNRIIIAAQPSLHSSLWTYDLAVGGAASGPFQVTASDTLEHAICFGETPPEVFVATHVTDATQTLTRYRSFDGTAGTFGTVHDLHGVRLASGMVFSDGDLMFAVRQSEEDDTQSNQLVMVDPDDSAAVTIMVAKDFEISAAQLSSTQACPDLRISTNGKVYWGNFALASDGQLSPRITELEVSSAARRQVCQAGALMFIGGGMPLVYDGVMLAENCFINRPVIVSVTGDAGGGDLLLGATYFYKLIWEALDCDDNIVRSAVSAFFEWESDQTAADVVCETPLTMRANESSSPTGSSVRLKLYRTVAVSEEFPAVITGSEVADPPASSLDGLFLKIRIEDSGGGTTFTVVFDSGDTTITAILATINALTTGRVTASSFAGRVRLTSDESGEGVFLNLPSGSAKSVLGLGNDTEQGTTTSTTGDVFHLCATSFVAPGTEGAEQVTITDEMSDEELREQQILYTQAENPLDHHPSGPADLCASGGENVVVAGQPKRDRWTASKPFATAQGIQFANPGREKFGRRVRGEIEAIVQRDEEVVLLTRREIWSIAGSGPTRDGKSDFQRQRLVYGEGGLRRDGWRSVVTTKEGTFFQLDDDKIYTHGAGGEPKWIGHPVVDTLALYPVIVAACHVRQLQTIAFACQSEDGLSGVLLRYDLRREQWFEDDIGPISALAEHEGRLAMAIDGEVFLQDEAFGSGTMPVLLARLGSFTDFGSLGAGAITCFTVLGQYRGPCTIELQISYDDTQTWVTCGIYTLDGSNYVTGQPIELEYTPAIQECSRFALQAIVTGTEEDSGGAWLIALDIHSDKDRGPARKGQAFTR